MDNLSLSVLPGHLQKTRSVAAKLLPCMGGAGAVHAVLLRHGKIWYQFRSLCRG
jgi:hypothetical protein